MHLSVCPNRPGQPSKRAYCQDMQWRPAIDKPPSVPTRWITVITYLNTAFKAGLLLALGIASFWGVGISYGWMASTAGTRWTNNHSWLNLPIGAAWFALAGIGLFFFWATCLFIGDKAVFAKRVRQRHWRYILDHTYHDQQRQLNRHRLNRHGISIEEHGTKVSVNLLCQSFSGWHPRHSSIRILETYTFDNQDVIAAALKTDELRVTARERDRDGLADFYRQRERDYQATADELRKAQAQAATEQTQRQERLAQQQQTEQAAKIAAIETRGLAEALRTRKH